MFWYVCVKNVVNHNIHIMNACLLLGGKFITASDDILSNQLLNGFSSLTIPTGDQTKDPVQV